MSARKTTEIYDQAWNRSVVLADNQATNPGITISLWNGGTGVASRYITEPEIHELIDALMQHVAILSDRVKGITK